MSESHNYCTFPNEECMFSVEINALRSKLQETMEENKTLKAERARPPEFMNSNPPIETL